METVSDKRVIKTKKIIKNAVLKLAEDKEIEKISVTDIANEALIQRNTFYCYYSGVHDVISDIANDICATAAENLKTRNALSLKDTVHCFFDEIYLQLAGLGENYKSILFCENNLTEMMHMQNWLAEAIKEKNEEYAFFPVNELTSHGIYVLSAATIQSFSEWFKNGSSISFAEYIKFLEGLVINFSVYFKTLG